MNMEKKKVAILSLYHNNYNYGGLLQSYALCIVLRQYGIDARQISYELQSGYPGYKGKMCENMKHIIKMIIYGKYYRKLTVRNRKLHQFELAIPHTRNVNAKNIKKLNNDFDVFICGSDQIWNPIGWQEILFLSFVEPGKQKIAYAASMARDKLTKEEAEYALNYIKNFDAVSLREKESIDAMKEYDDSFIAEVMPDPTLLLTDREWSQIAATKMIEKSYIFAYFLGGNLQQREQAIQYAKNRNKKIYFIKYLDITYKKWEENNKEYMIDNVGINEFLSLIKNAEMVITDSFHGAVFSSIFETPFVVLNRFFDDDNISMNSRITTLMETLKINRIVTKLDCNNEYSFCDEELLNIENSLKLQREKGRKYLLDTLKEDLL